MSERSLLCRLVVQIEEEQELKTQVCDHLKEMAHTIDVRQCDTSIARTVFASAGLAGFVLTVAGLLLAPITFGVSLGLTVIGQVIDVKRAKTCFTKRIADDVLQSKTLADTQSMFNKYQEAVRVLLDICDELEVLDKHQLKRICKQNLGSSATSEQRHIRSDVVKGLKTAVSTGGYAVQGVTLRSPRFDVSDTTIWDVVNAAMEILTIGDVVIYVLSVPLDLYSIFVDVVTIHSKLPSETAEETRRLAGYLTNNGNKQMMEQALAHIENMTRKSDRPHWESTIWKLVSLRLQVLGTVLIMFGIIMAIVELDYGFDKLIRYGVIIVILSGVSCLSFEVYIQLKTSLCWREADSEVNAFMHTNLMEVNTSNTDVPFVREIPAKFKNYCLHIRPMAFVDFTDIICISAKLILDALALGSTLTTHGYLDTLPERSPATGDIRVPHVGAVAIKTHEPGLSVDVSGAIWYLVTMPFSLATLLTCWTETIGRQKTPFKEAVERLVNDIRNDISSDI